MQRQAPDCWLLGLPLTPSPLSACARARRFAHYAYEQLVEAGFSQEAIKLAGYGKLSWTFGGYTWGTKIGLPAGENIDA